MTNIKILRTGALLLLLSAVLFIRFFYEPSYEGTGEPVDRIEGTFVEQVNVRRPHVYVPPDTSSTHGIDRDLWAAPRSNWLINEEKSAKAALLGIRPTLAIIPVQGDINAFDPIERSLITRLVRERAALGRDEIVLPAGPVIRYFGTNRAIYASDDIKQFAKFTGSREVLVMHAQHDRNGNWELRASLVDGELEPLKDERVWSNLVYNDDEPPSVALEAILDEIVEFATERSGSKKEKKYEFPPDDFVFPDSVADLIARSETTPLNAAAYLQFLASLHPLGQFNETRNHLYERSLVKLQQVSPSSPYYRYFKARAYAFLGRRPAALAALGKPMNSHESSLLDFLNGNLIDLRLHVSETGTSVLDFMAWRDMYQLEWRYKQKQPHDFMDRLIHMHPVWAPFIERSVQDFETWSSSSMAAIKLGLEDLLPVPEVSIRDRVARMLVTGEVLGELELTRLVWRHIDAVNSAATPSYKSAEIASHNATVNDILELAKTIAVANHIGRITDDLKIRDLPKSALAKISAFEPIFSGHPAITLLKGRAQKILSADSQGSEKYNLTLASANTLLNGFAWTSTITPEAATVARQYSHLLQTSSYKGPSFNSENYLSGYSRRFFEWPRGPNWYYEFGVFEGANGALEQCLAYRSTSFRCLKLEIERRQRNAANPGAIRDELLTANAHRFAGDPERSEYEIQVSRASDSVDSEVARLKKQIEAGSVNWAPFKLLGQHYKRRGEYEEAANVWLSYPGFQRDTNVDRVTISNYADVSGAMLYWIGQYELAMPFLNIAASTSTGSGAQLTAAQRIALIDGDLDTAADWAAARVRRYNSKYGLRDLLQILHIRDQSEFAWSIFDEIPTTMQSSQLWSGALVGHRMNSASIVDIAEWVKSSEVRRNAVAKVNSQRSVDLAPRYILLAGTMDRAPNAELVKLVASAHSRPKPLYMHLPKSVSETGEPEPLRAAVSSYAGYRQHDDMISNPRDERRAGPNEAIENRYTMIASAMVAFNNGNFDAAYEAFNETAYYYLLDEYLPYHVFSAAVSGHADHLAAALKAREPALEAIRKKETSKTSSHGYRFDEDLAYAVLFSFDKDHERAIEYLNKALNNRPYINDRSVYPLYQIVDLADLLHEHTGDDAYREFALELSRRHTVVLPMYAWAYYVVAKYSPSSVERVSATASGLKLDPLSHRGKHLPDELRTRALELLNKTGAPYLSRTATPNNEST